MRITNLEVNTEAVRKMLFNNSWTINELAEKAGVSLITANRFVNGRVLPYPSTMKKLCKALGCTPAEITREKEDKPE